MKRWHAVVLALAAAIAGFLIRQQVPRSAFSSPTILAQVQQLSQLTTVRYTVQKIVTLTEEKKPLGSESILLIVQARVEAGIDLSAIREQDIIVAPDGTVTIALPRPTILNAAIDEKDTKVWDRQKTWWTPWVPYSLDLEKKARLAGLETAKAGAIEMGILPAAQHNAESAIRSLLGLAGIRKVVIRTATS